MALGGLVVIHPGVSVYVRLELAVIALIKYYCCFRVTRKLAEVWEGV